MKKTGKGWPRWFARARAWGVYVYVDGRRLPDPIMLPGIPREDVEGARAAAAGAVAFARANKVVPVDRGETVREWFGRYYDWRATQPLAETVPTRRSRTERWILRVKLPSGGEFGRRAMTAVSESDVRAVAKSLEDEVATERISPKTACNIWGDLTKGFSDARELNDETLRVRDDNPTTHVRGPKRAPPKAKPILRPDEIVTLLACEAIPVARRRKYALAIYTGARASEQRGFDVESVDFRVMRMSVDRQVNRVGRVKDRTKTGRRRVFPIEPALVPLLKFLIGDRKSGPLIARDNHKDPATQLRIDLKTAGVDRPELHVATAMRDHLTFHNLRDTHLTHRAVRGDDPRTVQWVAGHTTPNMTEAYVAQARYEAGIDFGQPFPPLPESLFGVAPKGPDGVEPSKMRVTFTESEPLEFARERENIARSQALSRPGSTPVLRTHSRVISKGASTQCVARCEDPGNTTGADFALRAAVLRAAADGDVELVARLGRKLAARARDAAHDALLALPELDTLDDPGRPS